MGQAMLYQPLRCLTSVFGMGTGVSISLLPPDLRVHSPKTRQQLLPSLSLGVRTSMRVLKSLTYLRDQTLDRLVSVNSVHHCTSISDLLPRRLQGILLLSNGKSHLGVGFTLRCLQRLSDPQLATRLCSWRNNRCTSGSSDSVLSY